MNREPDSALDSIELAQNLCKHTSRLIVCVRRALSDGGVASSKQKRHALRTVFVLEAPPGIGPGNKGFADLCLTTWLWRRE